ncbi:FAD/NAD(P)-binding domain-containing protein [Venturia nashicola]|uniref:FAD/NAD(P)-binding domain-containing protein n=1 Tax=Venturia nashicola TaxID=86259 RepID=A0A4Z1NZJ1_9PEZI|nr:FAD/NAD(P)-binding domain-containing protein [Venturia nashicola]
MRVAIIGAGPSGLATLKYLTTAHEYFDALKPIEAQLFESEASIGGTFKHRAYEGVEFNLWPNIRLSTSVTKVERVRGGGHIVHYVKDGEKSTWPCDAVAVCSGLHVVPNLVSFPGLENVPVAFHSSQFKDMAQLGANQNLLIVGSGETGMDLAYMAVTSEAKSVTLCHRDGFHVAPKRAPEPVWFGINANSPPALNVPYDVGSASLFDTAYVHPLLQNSFLSAFPWAYYDRFTKWSGWFTSGTYAGLDQWIGGLPAERYHASKIFFNKSTKAMPYISAQYRTNSLLNKIRACIAQVRIPETGGRNIDLAPWPSHFDEKGVVRFTENGRPEAEVMRNKTVRPDIVILATGYTQSFPFLDSNYPTPQDANIRRIWREGDESIGFIGFVRPSFGAIPPLSELQAQLWILSILGRLPESLKPVDHYRLHHAPNSRIQYGVDHEAYAYQLATDIGSAASFTSLLPRGLKLTLCWALSANVNPKFRLTGPWKWNGAQQVMETEIWSTIARRRGFFGHLTLSIIPMILFGSTSALLYLLCAVFSPFLAIWNLAQPRKKVWAQDHPYDQLAVST